MRWRRALAYLSIAAGLSMYAYLHRFGSEHLALLGIIVMLGSLSTATRDFLIATAPLIIFSFAYSFMKVFEPHAFETVHIEAVYRFEETLFGWLATGDLGPVDFFRNHHHALLDALSGLLYATHMPALIGFGIYLWWTHYSKPTPESRSRLHNYMWGFLAMAMAALLIHLLYPVAPPWYVEKFGLVAPNGPVAGDPAALARVDDLLGFDYFAGVYSHTTYVFGALPSLHVAFPVWLALHVRHRIGRVVAWGFAAAMGFSAVYLIHHYIVDVVAGAILSGGVYALLQTTRLGEFPPRLHDWLFELYFGEPSDEEVARIQTPSGGE